MRRLVLSAVLLAAACGGNSNKVADKPSRTPSPPAATGPSAFLAFAHGSSYGSLDFAGAPDSNLLSLGNNVCDGLDSGLTFAKVTQGLVQSRGKPTVAEAETLSREAVKDLCANHTSDLP